jgi:hypothetical protein
LAFSELVNFLLPAPPLFAHWAGRPKKTLHFLSRPASFPRQLGYHRPHQKAAHASGEPRRFFFKWCTFRKNLSVFTGQKLDSPARLFPFSMSQKFRKQNAMTTTI